MLIVHRSFSWSWLALLLCIVPAMSFAGPPFQTDDPEPVEYRHWEVYGFATGNHFSDESSGVLPALEVNYGVVPDVQLHLIAPLAYDDQSGRHAGYGDTELGIKYRFVHEDDHGWRPQAGIFPLIELPTGNADNNLGAGHTQLFIPVWVQKSLGDCTMYGGGGYWFTPSDSSSNHWFMGWLIQRQVTHRLTLGAELFHQTAGTSEASSGFNVGGVFDFTDHDHLLFSTGRGLQNVAQTNVSSYYIGFQWTN